MYNITLSNVSPRWPTLEEVGEDSLQDCPVFYSGDDLAPDRLVLEETGGSKETVEFEQLEVGPVSHHGAVRYLRVEKEKGRKILALKVLSIRGTVGFYLYASV